MAANAYVMLNVDPSRTTEVVDRMLEVKLPVGVIAKRPPFSESRIAPKMLGESKRGIGHQSIDPLLLTRAAEWRSPIRP